MKRSRPQPLPFLHSFERWNRFAADQTAMLWAAGEVIDRRTTTMVTHGIAPNAKERREMERMVEEKQSALLEGSLAAWNEWMRLARASWLDALQTTMRNRLALPPVMTNLNPLDTQLRIVNAAFGPTRAAVAANRKRLAA